MPPDHAAFANRLRKMDRHLGKWARRKNLACYRVYDADVPGFPFAVDRYDGHLHVAEYRRRSTPEGEGYPAWRDRCLETLAHALMVDTARIFYKTRQRQRGLEQYERVGQARRELVVEEYGLRFYVNLSDYLDTGLFLDHRLTRRRVRAESLGRSFLNLFAYTGSFTVYAAAGGARHSLTLDLSNTYLDWARRNLALNGLDGPGHRFRQTDVLQWLAEPAGEQYDLIVLDPPTFSNSKRMEKVLDTQRDHLFLLRACLERLTPDGTLYFSTNYRKFELDEAIWEEADGLEITGQTVPPDFARRRPHRCWKLSRKPSG